MRPLMVLLLLATILFTGCASTKLTGTLPQIPNPEQTAELYLIRTNAFPARARSVNVSLDGDEILRLSSSRYTRLTVPADEYNREHSVAAKAPGGGWDQVNILCKPGGEHYFLISTGWGAGLIREITKEEAGEWIEKSEFVDLVESR